MPSNLYGPYDHYDSATAHLIAAALGKMHAAVTRGAAAVEVWGDGTARREFTYAGDLADWLVEQLGRLEAWPVALNLGCGIGPLDRRLLRTPPTRPASTGSWGSIRPSPPVFHAVCSTRPGHAPSAGTRRPTSGRASLRPTTTSSPHLQRTHFDQRQPDY